MREELYDVLSNQSGPNAGGMSLATEPVLLVCYSFSSVGWSLCPVAPLRGAIFISFYPLTICYCEYTDIVHKDDDDNYLSRSGTRC